jgi:3-oxoacyl-[acyl-carrier protein] reductase
MRNVIVTGATRGLGLAIATALAGGGDRVIAVARTETAELREAGAALAGKGGGALLFRACDLADIAGIPTFVSGLRREFGSFYGLVNNAGLGTAGVLGMMRDADVERLTTLNVVSPILLTKYVLRTMMLARAGRIVNISSIVSATGYGGLAAYSATKAALVGFTRSLAREVGSLGITVNAVAPGFVNTEMTRDLGEQERAQIARRSALKRLPETADVAGAVEFLLSEKARNITGIVLTVDAGNTA